MARHLTETEIRKQLTERLVRMGYDQEDAKGFAEYAHVRTIDNFMSDGPGYIGQIVFVVYGGGPEQHEVFTVNADGTLDYTPSECQAE